MLKLLRTLINNGFVVLGLLVAVTLYLAYGQKPSVAESPDTALLENSPTAETDFIVEQVVAEPKTGEGVDAGETTTETPDEQLAETAETVEQAENTPEANESSEISEAAAVTEQPTDTPEAVAEMVDTSRPVTKAKSPEKGKTDESVPAPAEKTASEEPPKAVTKRTPQASTMAENTAAQEVSAKVSPKPAETATADQPETDKPVPGLLFDPARLDHRAILSRFEGPWQALAEAHAATRAGDYQWAAAIYFSLLKVRPNADVAGQLGNVLWRIGDRTWAHRAWRYAAQLLIREGRIDTARAFARNIRKVDSKLADEIEAHLPKTDTQLRKAQP